MCNLLFTKSSYYSCSFASVGMTNTRSMTRKQKKLRTSDNDDLESWSNLNPDLLLLIMMHMGVFDFIAFSGVCKSWRSVAISNWNKFMVSKQPMYLSISTHSYKKDCYLEDYRRRKLKTIIPHSVGRRCVGITCGYLIFFGRKARDFWLVNPFTRKELHFPGFPFPSDVTNHLKRVKCILVFSPSMFGWVLVISRKYSRTISFSLAGEQAIWRSISSNFSILDFHFFKGKIYMISQFNHLWELRLHDPEPALALRIMKNYPWPYLWELEFVSSGENLYLRHMRGDAFDAIEVDLDEMKWVNSERTTIGEHAVFSSDFKCDAAIKPDTWTHPWTRYEKINFFKSKRSGKCLTSKMWYFPHDCLIDNDSGQFPPSL
ncbi:putative F-box domain-containing protein [Helianthus annuus]|uniref:F-box domain-containing protein n=2 Tax=Helianthus annuus TaxID=4232 RepID=A0A9K3DSU1_HELAN|nr:putative F-box domain-containing protein [Helianthus annuus]KAJ0443948.1 putative F-box domain-containing protein [Helianthus annuus]KAJ0461348.1 putative F-box protein [Helianthus annuus]KAJ0641774.1 putative F-box protein [Helianthus annuus]